MNLDASSRYGSWSGRQIETFLDESRIPLRLSVMTRQGPLIVPVWFRFGTGGFWSCSPNESLLVNALHEHPEVAFDVSTNDIPYRGVRGRGVGRCSIAPDKSVLEELLVRYVDGTDNDLARWLLNRAGAEALIRIEVTWITSWDFSGRMGSIEKLVTRRPEGGV